MTANTMTPETSPARDARQGPLEDCPASSPARGPLINWAAVRPVDVATLAAVAAALGWAYAPNIASLVRTWNREPDYSHGFLVIPIALVILWKTWPDRPRGGAAALAARAGSW